MGGGGVKEYKVREREKYFCHLCFSFCLSSNQDVHRRSSTTERTTRKQKKVSVVFIFLIIKSLKYTTEEKKTCPHHIGGFITEERFPR